MLKAYPIHFQACSSTHKSNQKEEKLVLKYNIVLKERKAGDTEATFFNFIALYSLMTDQVPMM